MPPLPKPVQISADPAFSAAIAVAGGDRRARLSGLRAKLAALEAKHRREGSQDGDGLPAPTGISGLDARLGGGLPWGGVHELMAVRAGDRAAATGFALALAARLMAHTTATDSMDGGSFMWVYPRRLAQETGLPYGPGLMAFGFDPGRFVLVEAARSTDVLRAVEDALAAGPLTAVFALVDDTYGACAFTASRRFALAARTSGTSLFLLGGGEKLTSAAPLRWQVAPIPAPARTSSGPAPFLPRTSWRVELIRNRFGANGVWELEWNHDAGIFSEVRPRLALPEQKTIITNSCKTL